MSRWPVRPVDVVLNTVTGAEQAEAERLLRTEPAFRVEVERLRVARDAVRALPADAWGPEAPPALDTDAAFAARPPVAPSATARARGRAADALAAVRGAPALVLRPAAAFAAALVLLAVGVAVGVVADDPAPRATAPTLSAPEGREVALRTLEGGQTQRAAVRLPDRPGGEIELRVSGARPTRAGQFYELWLLDDAQHLTPVGTFRVGADGVARGRFPVGVDPSRYRYVDVSVERDDGDPGHSGRSIARSAALS